MSSYRMEVSYIEKVRMYRDMLQTKCNHAAVITHEKQIELLSSEVQIVADLLSDYMEKLDGRTT